MICSNDKSVTVKSDDFLCGQQDETRDIPRDLAIMVVCHAQR